MIEYDSVSNEYINEMLPKNKLNELYNPCYFLSCILGDYNGKIYSSMVDIIVTGLYISNPGTLILGESIPVYYTENLPSIKYNPKVCYKAYEMYNLLINGDTTYVVSGLYTSKLLVDALNLSRFLKLGLYALYLDTFALYIELLNVGQTSGMLASITRTDLSNMDNNIRYISGQIESLDSQMYDTIEVLRQLNRVILFIRKIKNLFTEKYQTDIDEYYDSIQGGLNYE